MNGVDLLLAALVLLGAWGGWRWGFVRAASDLLVLVASVLIALTAYRHLAAALEAPFPALGVWRLPLAFALTWLVARLLLGALSHRLVRPVPDRAHAHPANRAAGLLPGAANGLINATLATMLLLAAPLFDGLSAATRDSRIADHLARPAQWLESSLAPIFDPAAQRTLSKLTVRPESRDTVQLPFRHASPRPRPDLEARMLELVNEERGQRGLRPLRADPDLREVARAHSRDMFARGYFSHISPEGSSPFDRIRAADLRFLAAGENLALAQTLPTAHQGLMDSPGHRANILRPSFGRVGIGVLDGGMYGLMVTQAFRN